jgi:hypothetical protein
MPDFEIRSPHDATPTRKDGKTEWRVDDRRVSVSIEERGATLVFFFDPDTAWTGKAPLLEVRLATPATGKFEPWPLLPRLANYLQYARAALARDDGRAADALGALRTLNSTRRGLDDEFLRAVALAYKALVAEGEPYPVKTLAEMQSVVKSTASRWITAARARGYLKERKN